jgi:16S rRNA processing protein RimM
VRKRRNTNDEADAAVARGADAIVDTSTPSGADRVLLGRIVAAHGLRGEVKILTYTEVPENIVSYGPLTDAKGRGFRITDLRPLKGEAVVAQIAGVNSRTAAENLRGTELYVPRDCLPETDGDEWYCDDLVGLQAVTLEGEPFGEVISVQNFGAGDLLELRLPGQRHTVFLAFTHASVPAVDIEAKRVTVVPPAEIIAQPEADSTPDADAV